MGQPIIDSITREKKRNENKYQKKSCKQNEIYYVLTKY